MQYELSDKETRPEYQFLVRAYDGKDYLLFDDYEEAFCAAESLSYSNQTIAFLYERHLFPDGTYRAVHLMKFFDDGDCEEAFAACELHYKYYTDAGRWMNPPK